MEKTEDSTSATDHESQAPRLPDHANYKLPELVDLSSLD
jgi:hypothetical protein